ncbi:hypothetical protein BJV78DRAFT_1121158 [Lactifluus subvellereus]|nr:hypothetical protein BJV78DRAFT_1121158 [Lactifluus subvellereus]
MSYTVSAKQNSQRVVRHAEYYIHGGDVIFLVESNLFRVHRYFFTRDSAFFRDKLPYPPPAGELTKGGSDSNPLVLEDALQVDFERFLWVFYNPKYSLYNANAEEWTSILRLAHQWEFVEVKSLALRELERLEIPPLRKIVIYHSYAIDRNLLQAAYTALTVRDGPITIEEGRELGLETALQLARARELARAPSGGAKSGHPQSLVNVAGAGLDALIRDLFHLPPPDQAPDCHASLSTLSERGASAPHDETQLGTQVNGVSSTDANSGQGG